MKTVIPFFLLAFIRLAAKNVLDPIPYRQFAELNASCNLVVEIKNVADQGVQHHNTTLLVLNRRIVFPASRIDSLTNTHHYYLYLPPGKHTISGRYHLINRWDNQEYILSTATDSILTRLDQRRTAAITLQKKPNGRLKRAKNCFQESIEAIQPIEVNKIASKKMLSERYTTPLTSSDDSDSLIVQINTVPLFVRLILDDRYIGHSPARVKIDRREDHVIQFYLSGFRSKIILLDMDEMHNKGALFLCEELEQLE